MERRWRKEKERAVPSASAVFRYLAGFHEAEERVVGKAIIPRSNEHLQGLQRVNEEMVGWLQKHKGETTATLDMDATLVETTKAEALYCYKHYKAYQPLNTYWAEAGVVLHSEFRDGNVPAGYEQLRVFQEALESLPAGVETVRLRSDTAGYQHDLLRYCELGEHERFGRIEFAISSDVTPAFKKAVCQVGGTGVAADIPGGERAEGTDVAGVGGGVFCTEQDGAEEGVVVSVYRDPGAHGAIGVTGGGGGGAARVAVSDSGATRTALQGVCGGDEHEGGRG